MVLNNISAILWWSDLLVGGAVENDRPAASHKQTLLNKVLSSTSRHEWDSNPQLWCSALIAQVLVAPAII